MSQLTAQQRHDQITRDKIALVDILGFFPTYFRPPYTQCSADCSNDLGALGYHVVNYDIDTRDWQGDYTYAQNTYSTILTQHSPAPSAWISLAHDIQPDTVHGLRAVYDRSSREAWYYFVGINSDYCSDTNDDYATNCQNNYCTGFNNDCSTDSDNDH
ncbi:hypothetical protein SCARD494_06022 [Seiridium cardinale]